ncbi:MAG: hypothetical protein P794_09710 [Epsilonproteobacteria bacterium (ex Lamellibrachia satsuma)]|nr:MAG: hypothetical protein P794_09710 [Epsilonproteobacteria bacterium (ex Lamellibrachia satsuma)]
MTTKYLFSKRFVTVVVTAIGLCFGVLAYAAEFSADLRVTEDNNKTESGKLYVKSDLVRMEKLKGADQAILITDVQKNVTSVLDVKGKRYFVLPMDITGFIPPREIIDNTVKKQVGSENVGIRQCKKYQYFLPDSKKVVVTQWVDTTINFPVKVCYHNVKSLRIPYENGCWELSNIQEGPVDDALFQVPQNYQKATVSMIDMGDTGKETTQSSSAPRDETVMLIDMAKLEYTKGNKVASLLQLKYALKAVWQEIPFMAADVRLVNKRGSFEPRKSNIYKIGERIYLACHVLGYQFKEGRAQMTADFYFLDMKGEILFSQKNFGHFKMESAIPNPTTQLDFNFSMSGISAGNYVIKVVLHDKNSAQSIEFTKDILFK